MTLVCISATLVLYTFVPTCCSKCSFLMLMLILYIYIYIFYIGVIGVIYSGFVLDAQIILPDKPLYFYMCEEPELTHWVEVVRQIDVDNDIVHVAVNVVLRQLRHSGSSNPKICAEIFDAITDTDLAVIHWMHYLPRIMDQLQLAQHGMKCAMLKLLLRLLHTGHIKMCAENGTVIALLLEEIPCLALEELPYPVHIPGIMTNVTTCIAGVCTGGIIWSVKFVD